MSASIVTFANLGEKRNQPTADVVPVIEAFARKSQLLQVICQLHKNFYFGRTFSAVPASIRYPLRLVEKVCKVELSRRWVEDLFDYFAARKLGKADAVFFHGGFFLPRTLKKARAQGSITVDITRMAHLETNARLEKEEYARLGISSEGGVFKRLVEKHIHSNDFDYVIAISDFVKDSYGVAGFPLEKIFVAHPDIDTERFAPQAKTDTLFRVVYAGYTTPLKGLGYLLDAWEMLSLPDSELVLVGGYGEMPEKLKKEYEVRIAKFSNIVWVGNSLTPEKYYTSASVFVFPSLTEGFGRVTVEAMACGVPVITTENARGIVEDGKTGFVVPIRNFQAIAEKIRHLYDHQDIALQMGKDARKAVENKKPFGEAVYEIYQEILRREHNI